ncbi:helix-turn-helix transcriptional regulator [Clostridioides sp. ES-S-0145-01]|uniref:helix-turn-helix domain-containing protein n=1 Tax=Clostridioides sp. ES-S-0145-01 TaxID=2770784 RepID=UPI001D0F678E|nr:helix-turn-helix transcriptional regulator [Clostridioides sp. ES-S-0145-01]
MEEVSKELKSKEIGKRLNELRTLESLSQRAFGERIYLSQDQISLLEKGKRILTERSINDICREFEVNEEWLRNGTGEIYKDCLVDLEVDDDVKEITNKLYELEQEDRDAILKMIELLQKKNK